MAKEKTRLSDLENAPKEIYYEIIGVVSIALALIIWEELGVIGKWTKIIIKICFGNWSFLLIIFLLLFGIFSLFLRKMLTIRSIRVKGLAIIYLALMILSHNSLYQYSLSINDNSLLGTWEIYMNYVNTLDNSLDLGGGFVGAIIYQLMIFLLGNVGTTLVSIILVILGIIFVSNNNLESFYSFLRKAYNRLKYYVLKAINHFKNMKPQMRTKKRPQKGLNLLSDSDVSINSSIQNNISNDQKKAIEAALLSLKYSYQVISFDIGDSATRFCFRGNINEETLIKEVKKRTSLNYIYHHENSFNLIEYNNRFRELLTLKSLLLNSSKIPLGKEINGSIIEFDFDKDKHLIVRGDYNSGIKTFIKGFLSSIKLSNDNVLISIFDPQNEFIELKAYQDNPYGYQDKDLMVILNRATQEIEKRLDLLSYFNVQSFEEINKEILLKAHDVDTIPRMVILINGLEYAKNDGLISKLVYLLQMSNNLGISLVFVSRVAGSIPVNIRSMIPTKMVFKVKDISNSIEILNSHDALYIEPRGEFIAIIDDKRYRGQTGFLSNTDYMNILSK